MIIEQPWRCPIANIRLRFRTICSYASLREPAWLAHIDRAVSRLKWPKDCTLAYTSQVTYGGSMQATLQGLRYAIRQARNSPGFAITVLATLTLGYPPLCFDAATF